MNKIKSEEVLQLVIDKIDKLIREKVEINKNRTLHIISLSDDPASEIYMRNKVNMAKEYGINAIIHKPKDKLGLFNIMISEVFSSINNRFIMQLPYDTNKWNITDNLINSNLKFMDIDGFKFDLQDLTRIKNIDDMINHPNFSPTAKGVLLILDTLFDGNIKGRQATILGKGITSGLPIALMCEQLGLTVTWCNSSTLNRIRQETIENSEIIVSCVGKEIINKDLHSKIDNACYINVGMFKEEDKLKGDINYNDIIKLDNTLFCNKLFNSTGKLTTMCLILNTVL